MVERSSLIALDPPTYADQPLLRCPPWGPVLASAFSPVSQSPRRDRGFHRNSRRPHRVLSVCCSTQSRTTQAACPPCNTGQYPIAASAASDLAVSAPAASPAWAPA